MKLYTEEQVKNFLKERTFMTEDAIDKLCAPLIPIELPSDEYIDEVFQPMTELNAFYKDGFINGAKWMREQIDNTYFEKEKELIENAFDMGRDETTRNFIEDGEDYYNQKYNQTNVGNDGFEFDNSSTIPPTKGLCDAKSIYGSELNKELTLDERMHLWFESSRPNRDVCDYVDEMNDIDKAKYLDGCGISRTTKNK